jgi:hypothetical protein
MSLFLANGICAICCVRISNTTREPDRRLAKHDQILQKALSLLSLFDAMPFLAFPHFVARARFCVTGPEKRKRNRAKEW